MLHDYCSYSPDWLGTADFRGACALHDLCYQAVNNKVGSHHDCNLAFLADLRKVCDGQTYGRVQFRNAARTYYRVVNSINP
ncbi:phospholipase A2 [Corynebacterium uterequi]|uniref:phospholipase A2 n=1 Tax=Corynebacterium uterequi TaxID=1072256 RepID=UPI002E81CBA2|nr:phospholipase A2 [Corynebacterium uterequi]